MDKSIKKYRNYEKTEKAIKNALIKLYKEKRSITKITVKELCEVANISRSTFYLHYNDLISVFESVGDTFVKSLEKMITELAKDFKFDFYPYLQTIFTMINESNHLLKIGLSSEFPLAYIDSIKVKLENIIRNQPLFIKSEFPFEQLMSEIRIIVAGMIDFIINLIRTEQKIDVNKYATILTTFLTAWTNSIMSRNLVNN